MQSAPTARSTESADCATIALRWVRGVEAMQVWIQYTALSAAPRHVLWGIHCGAHTGCSAPLGIRGSCSLRRSARDPGCTADGTSSAPAISRVGERAHRHTGAPRKVPAILPFPYPVSRRSVGAPDAPANRWRLSRRQGVQTFGRQDNRRHGFRIRSKPAIHYGYAPAARCVEPIPNGITRGTSKH